MRAGPEPIQWQAQIAWCWERQGSGSPWQGAAGQRWRGGAGPWCLLVLLLPGIGTTQMLVLTTNSLPVADPNPIADLGPPGRSGAQSFLQLLVGRRRGLQHKCLPTNIAPHSRSHAAFVEVSYGVSWVTKGHWQPVWRA